MMLQNNEPFERLTEVITEQFAALCTQRDYRVMTQNADRHGSLVWEAGQAGDLNRYVLLGIAEVPAATVPAGLLERTQQAIGDIQAVFEAELWIGIDDNTRFSRSLYDRWSWFFSATMSTASVMTPLPQLLASAIDRATRLTRDDITEEDVIPRG